MSIAIGTPIGLVAGLILLATGAALIACLALLPDHADVASLITIAACAGLPPGIAFGARVLGVEATFEGGDFLGLFGLAGMAVWAIWVVASARAVGLPGAGGPAENRFPRAAAAIAVGTLVAGPGLAAISYGFADPVSAGVMQPVPVALATRLTDVITTSTVLPALALLGPLLLIAAFVYPGLGFAEVQPQPRPPLLNLPVGAWWSRAQEVAMAAKMPEQYRSLVNFRELEQAATGARPWLWIAALVALGFAVTR